MESGAPGRSRPRLQESLEGRFGGIRAVAPTLGVAACGGAPGVVRGLLGLLAAAQLELDPEFPPKPPPLLPPKPAPPPPPERWVRLIFADA